jgi:hypothetical protein
VNIEIISFVVIKFRDVGQVMKQTAVSMVSFISSSMMRSPKPPNLELLSEMTSPI